MEDRKLLGGRGPHYLADTSSGPKPCTPCPKLLHVTACILAFHLATDE